MFCFNFQIFTVCSKLKRDFEWEDDSETDLNLSKSFFFQTKALLYLIGVSLCKQLPRSFVLDL